MSAWMNEWKENLDSIWKMDKTKSFLKEKVTLLLKSVAKLTYQLDVA